MNFKIFIEQLDDGFLLESEKYGRKVIEKEHKVKILADNIDRDLYRRYYSKHMSKMIPAKLIAARYAYLRPDLQKLSEESGVYFKNVDMQQDRSPGTLVIVTRGNEETSIVDTYIKKLKERLENYPAGNKTVDVIPYLKRFGGSGKVGITSSSGVTPARLGLEGPEKAGWIVGYHWTGQATSELTPDEEKYAEKPSAIDLNKDISDKEKSRVKKLTASGNKFIDDILFNPEEIETDLKDIDGGNLTNKQVLSMAKKYIRKWTRQDEDPQDMLSSFAFLLRKKYGDIDKYPDANQLIASLVKNAIRDVREDMGTGRKQDDLLHGKKTIYQKLGYEKKHGGQAGRSTSIAAGHILQAGDDDMADASRKERLPTIDDLNRRLNLTQKDTTSKTREEVPEEPSHGIRTYKSADITPEEEADEIKKSLHQARDPSAIRQKSTATSRILKPAEVEKATSDELEDRRQKLLSKIRGMQGTSSTANEPKKTSALDRLRQRFKVA